MRILILDNYDSFTYNLVHYVEELTERSVDVFRNDEIMLEEISRYDKIILSPGPGIPENAGIMKEIISKYAKTISIFGVCLGMQAIAEVFGGEIYNSAEVYHGISTNINISDTEDIIFNEIPENFSAGRYHSWVVKKYNLPDCLKITSIDDEGNIMSLRHNKYDVCGVQFHPESVLTPFGKKIIENWLNAD